MGVSKFLGKYLTKTHLNQRIYCHKTARKPPWSVLFFGSDDFSIFSLDALNQEYRKGNLIKKLEVVTTVKGKPNPLKNYAENNNLMLHKWPPLSLTRGQFDVGLVVSFGHFITKDIIEKFEFGMINVHASLLPRWRGAAPIIYALAKGDSETGVTIMKISPDKFDVGEILKQESVKIHPDMKMRELYRILGQMGARNLVQTLENLPLELSRAKAQPEGATYAPKIKADMAQIDWKQMTAEEVYNLSRALDGVFSLQANWGSSQVKLVNFRHKNEVHSNLKPGHVEYDPKDKVLKILCSDFRFVTVEKVGVSGKKMMTAADFNNGYIKKEPPNSRYFT